ncbi:MAG: alpha/beta hydrolase, partial [Syntrophobacterales bacterium]
LLEKTGCNGLLYDRWGHGRSDPLDGKRTLRYVHDEALDSLPDVLRRCEVDDSVLIGHSDGGSIALIFAAEYSERVRGIITEAAHVFVEEITLEGIKDALEVYRSTDLKEKSSHAITGIIQKESSGPGMKPGCSQSSRVGILRTVSLRSSARFW